MLKDPRNRMLESLSKQAKLYRKANRKNNNSTEQRMQAHRLQSYPQLPGSKPR